MRKEYLGDSVYAEAVVGDHILLTTENGLPGDPSNRIYLDPEVVDALISYVRSIRSKAENGGRT